MNNHYVIFTKWQKLKLAKKTNLTFLEFYKKTIDKNKIIVYNKYRKTKESTLKNK